MPANDEKALEAGHETKLLPPPKWTKRQGGPRRRVLFLAGGGVLLVLLLLLFIGYLPRHRRKKEIDAAAQREAEALPKVNVTQVKPAPNVTNIMLPGSVTPFEEAYLYARATGYVRHRYADIGDRVRQGQLLAEIDAPDLDAQVYQGRAALAQAEQQLAQAHAALENSQAQEDLARVTWQRYSVLVSHGAVSRQDADQQLASYKTAQANVRLQQAGIHSAEENVQAARGNVERLVALQDFEKLRAPFSGIITARNFDVGALISTSGGSLGASTTPMGGTQISGAQGNAGANGTASSAGQGTANSTSPGIGNSGEMYRIAQISTVRVLVNVPQSGAPSIHVGQPATVFVEELAGRPFNGRVTRTATALDPTTRTLLSEIDVPNPQSFLLPGMYAQVRFAETRSTPPLLVPGDAVITSAEGMSVAVLRDPTPQQRQQLEQGERERKERSKSKEARKEQQKEEQEMSQAKQIHLERVTVGRDYGPEIEITGGLQGGEFVVVNPGDEILEGALVSPEAAPPVEGEGKQDRQGSSEQRPSGITSPSREAPTPGKQDSGGKKQGSQGSGSKQNTQPGKSKGGVK
jgi:multidrug efflux pump subunit AcrA (membrane-fusion protein)